MVLIPSDKNMKKKPEWELKEVKMKDMNSKETLKFKYNSWLGTEKADHDLMREAPAVRPGRTTLPG